MRRVVGPDGLSRPWTCPAEYDPSQLWSFTDCGPMPDWYKQQRNIYRMQMEQIGAPEQPQIKKQVLNDRIQLARLINHSRKIFMKVKEPTNRLRITLPPGYFILCQNPRIQKLLGWANFKEQMVTTGRTYINSEISNTSVIYGNASQLHYRAILLPEPCDFGRNNRILYVYSNLVKSSNVGMENLPLIKIVNLSDKSFKTPLFHQNFPSPQYLPVKQQTFRRIEFFLANDLGEDFPFQRGENCILVLHFRYNKKT